MSKRLQVLVSDEELEALRAVARRTQVSVGEWVRVALRSAVAESDVHPIHEKLKAINVARQHQFPSGEVGLMNAQIEEGALSGLH